ncbi:MAG: trypsin-like serine protease [Cryobacterium sp.]|nr:trypsin-like serine protease [Oligoflexia bacterium]
MRNRLFVSILMVCGYALAAISAHAIDHGERILPGAMPSVFGFRMESRFLSEGGAESFCSGFAVSPRLILTAAHCLTGRKFLDRVGNGIRIGSRENGAQTYLVKRFAPHPEYRSVTGNRSLGDPEVRKAMRTDVGYLKVDRDIEPGAILPIYLSDGIAPPRALITMPVATVGYGIDSFTELRAAQGGHSTDSPIDLSRVHFGEKKTGMRSVDAISPEAVSLSQGEKYGALPGDSGGPMIVIISGVPTAVALNHLYTLRTEGSGRRRKESYGETIGTLMTAQNLCWVVRDSGERIPGVKCDTTLK